MTDPRIPAGPAGARPGGPVRRFTHAPPNALPPDALDPSPHAPRWLRFVLVRLAAVPVMYVGLLIAGGAVSEAVEGATGRAGSALAELLGTVAGVLAATALYVLFVRVGERRAPAELAPGAAVRSTAVGIVLGSGLFAATIAAIAVCGGYRVTGNGTVSGVVSLLSFALYAGVVEELIFRAVVFRIVEEWAGTWIALALSAALFGAVHLANDDATLWGATAIAVEAGILLASAYVLTRRLWLPIGLHAAWNFTQGGIFGVVISGSGVGREGLFTGRLSGPTAISGGAFGAEASVFAVAFCLAAAVLLLLWAHRAGQLRPPRWRRRAAGSMSAP